MIGAIQKELERIKTKGLGAFKTNQLVSKIKALGKSQLKALGRFGGRWHNMRLGTAYNTWECWVHERASQQKLLDRAQTFWRSASHTQFWFEQWRKMARKMARSRVDGVEDSDGLVLHGNPICDIDHVDRSKSVTVNVVAI